MATKKTAKKTRNNLNVDGKPTPSPAQFIHLYNKAESKKEALKLIQEAGFHMNMNNLTQRVTSYTKAGAPIKEMPKGTRALDVNDIAAEIARLDAEAGEQQDQEDTEKAKATS